MREDNKVLFVHDGPVMIDKTGSKYYGVHYNDKVIEWYSYFGKTVTFLMRTSVIQDYEARKYSAIEYPAFRLIAIPDFKSVRGYLNIIKATRIIEKAVHEHDVIIVRLPSATGTIALKYARKINKPALVEMVACVFDALWNYDWRGKLLAHFKVRKYQRLLEKTSHVIYVTESFLQGRYPTNGKSIGCSDVVLDTFDNETLKKRIDKIRGMPDDVSLTLGTVSAVNVKYKGQQDVIKAIAALNHAGIAAKYKIVGQGDPERLASLIKKYKVSDLVEVIGPMQHSEIFTFYQNIDIYVQPSRVEGMPRAVIEACSTACPVFGTMVGGIPELINEKHLYQPGNIDQLVSFIKRVSKISLIEMANENFKTASKFREELLDKKRLNFYRHFATDNGL